MIKLAFIFALLVTLPLADYIPQWSSCSDPSDSWHPTNVSLLNPPVHGQHDIATVCGESVDSFDFNQYNFKIKMLDIVVYSGHKFVADRNVTAGETVCFAFNASIPNYAIGTFEAFYTPLDSNGNERGCVQVDVTV